MPLQASSTATVLGEALWLGVELEGQDRDKAMAPLTRIAPAIVILVNDNL
jgi:hypothetical protein